MKTRQTLIIFLLLLSISTSIGKQIQISETDGPTHLHKNTFYQLKFKEQSPTQKQMLLLFSAKAEYALDISVQNFKDFSAEVRVDGELTDEQFSSLEYTKGKEIQPLNYISQGFLEQYCVDQNDCEIEILVSGPKDKQFGIQVLTQLNGVLGPIKVDLNHDGHTYYQQFYQFFQIDKTLEVLFSFDGKKNQQYAISLQQYADQRDLEFFLNGSFSDVFPVADESSHMDKRRPVLLTDKCTEDSCTFSMAIKIKQDEQQDHYGSFYLSVFNLDKLETVQLNDSNNLDLFTNLEKNQVTSAFILDLENDGETYTDIQIGFNQADKYDIKSIVMDIENKGFSAQSSKTAQFVRIQQASIYNPTQNYLIFSFPCKQLHADPVDEEPLTKDIQYTPYFLQSQQQELQQGKISQDDLIFTSDSQEKYIFYKGDNLDKITLHITNKQDTASFNDLFALVSVYQLKIQHDHDKFYPSDEVYSEKVALEALEQGDSSIEKKWELKTGIIQGEILVLVRFVYNKVISDQTEEVYFSVYGEMGTPLHYQPIHQGRNFQGQFTQNTRNLFLEGLIHDPNVDLVIQGQNMQNLKYRDSIMRLNLEIQQQHTRKDVQNIQVIKKEYIQKYCENQIFTTHCKIYIHLSQKSDDTDPRDINFSFTSRTTEKINDEDVAVLEPLAIQEGKDFLRHKSINQKYYDQKSIFHYSAKFTKGQSKFISLFTYPSVANFCRSSITLAPYNEHEHTPYPDPNTENLEHRYTQTMLDNPCGDKEICEYRMTVYLDCDDNDGSFYLLVQNEDQTRQLNLQKDRQDRIKFDIPLNQVQYICTLNAKNYQQFTAQFQNVLGFQVHYIDENGQYIKIGDYDNFDVLAIQNPVDEYILVAYALHQLHGSGQDEIIFSGDGQTEFLELKDEPVTIDLGKSDKYTQQFAYYRIKDFKTNQLSIKLHQNNDFLDTSNFYVLSRGEHIDEHLIYPTEDDPSYHPINIEECLVDRVYTQWLIYKNDKQYENLSFQEDDVLLFKFTKYANTQKEFINNGTAKLTLQIQEEYIPEDKIQVFNATEAIFDDLHFPRKEVQLSYEILVHNPREIFINFQNPILYDNLHFQILDDNNEVLKESDIQNTFRHSFPLGESQTLQGYYKVIFSLKDQESYEKFTLETVGSLQFMYEQDTEGHFKSFGDVLLQTRHSEQSFSQYVQPFKRYPQQSYSYHVQLDQYDGEFDQIYIAVSNNHLSQDYDVKIEIEGQEHDLQPHRTNNNFLIVPKDLIPSQDIFQFYIVVNGEENNEDEEGGSFIFEIGFFNPSTPEEDLESFATDFSNNHLIQTVKRTITKNQDLKALVQAHREDDELYYQVYKLNPDTQQLEFVHHYQVEYQASYNDLEQFVYFDAKENDEFIFVIYPSYTATDFIYSISFPHTNSQHKQISKILNNFQEQVVFQDSYNEFILHQEFDYSLPETQNFLHLRFKTDKHSKDEDWTLHWDFQSDSHSIRQKLRNQELLSSLDLYSTQDNSRRITFENIKENLEEGQQKITLIIRLIKTKKLTSLQYLAVQVGEHESISYQRFLKGEQIGIYMTKHFQLFQLQFTHPKNEFLSNFNNLTSQFIVSGQNHFDVNTVDFSIQVNSLNFTKEIENKHAGSHPIADFKSTDLQGDNVTFTIIVKVKRWKSLQQPLFVPSCYIELNFGNSQGEWGPYEINQIQKSQSLKRDSTKLHIFHYYFTSQKDEQKIVAVQSHDFKSPNKFLLNKKDEALDEQTLENKWKSTNSPYLSQIVTDKCQEDNGCTHHIRLYVQLNDKQQPQPQNQQRILEDEYEYDNESFFIQVMGQQESEQIIDGETYDEYLYPLQNQAFKLYSLDLSSVLDQNEADLKQTTLAIKLLEEADNLQHPDGEYSVADIFRHNSEDNLEHLCQLKDLSTIQKLGVQYPSDKFMILASPNPVKVVKLNVQIALAKNLQGTYPLEFQSQENDKEPVKIKFGEASDHIQFGYLELNSQNTTEIKLYSPETDDLKNIAVQYKFVDSLEKDTLYPHDLNQHQILQITEKDDLRIKWNKEDNHKYILFKFTNTDNVNNNREISLNVKDISSSGTIDPPPPPSSNDNWWIILLGVLGGCLVIGTIVFFVMKKKRQNINDYRNTEYSAYSGDKVKISMTEEI